MLGPNALTQQLLDSYLRYLFSAHPIGVHNPLLENDLRTELKATYQLVQGPILELDPSSKRGTTVANLITQGLLCPALGELVVADAKLSERALYSHQVGAIKASAAGKSVVIASGTGTGKTEAWLYPVISEMLATPRAGLRAVVLYPMNALADDQRRVRMRSLLTGTSVTYGEYTGNTPEDESDPYGRLDQAAPANELQTRKKLRANPPNILITNPTMLEYLLLRPEDNALLRDAHLQFLILDEAHTYRGAYGIELGHLMRRLRARLRVSSLRAFILSATIDRDHATLARFARNLTGEDVAPESMFFGEYEPTHPVSIPANRSPEAYAGLTAECVASILRNPTAVSELPTIDAFGQDQALRALDAPNGGRALWELLHNDGYVAALREKLQSGPQSIGDLAEVIGPHEVDADGIIARLVDAAASAREHAGGPALLPARYHVFLRGLDGIRVCFNPEHAGFGSGAYQVGKYFLTSRGTCDECGYPLWELLVCGDCAAWYVRDCASMLGSSDEEARGAEGTLHIVDWN
jgi:hypothetical protein